MGRDKQCRFKEIIDIDECFRNDSVGVETNHIGGHTLDHVYANEAQIELKTWVADGLGISTDHLPIISEIPAMCTEQQYETVTFRKMKDVDVDAFKTEIKEVQERSFSAENNFEQNYINYRAASEAVLEKYYPLITKKVIRKENVKWMDEEYRKSRTERRKLEKRWKRLKTEESRAELIEQRKKCAKMSVEKQESFYAKVIEESGKNTIQSS